MLSFADKSATTPARLKSGGSFRECIGRSNPWVAFGELDQHLPDFARGLAGDERCFGSPINLTVIKTYLGLTARVDNRLIPVNRRSQWAPTLPQAIRRFRQLSRQRTLFRWKRAGYGGSPARSGIDAVHWVRLDSRLGTERAYHSRLPRRYLYRAIDRSGALVDVMFSEHRDMAAAQAFFQSAKTVTDAPDRVTTDGHDSYPRAIRTKLGDGEAPHQPLPQQSTGAGHRGIKVVPADAWVQMPTIG